MDVKYNIIYVLIRVINNITIENYDKCKEKSIIRIPESLQTNKRHIRVKKNEVWKILKIKWRYLSTKYILSSYKGILICNYKLLRP